jgi:hypothetical protein
MLCYKDTTFCGSKVKKHTCGRKFTKKDAKEAEKWWGGKDYPVAYSEFVNLNQRGNNGNRQSNHKRST